MLHSAMKVARVDSRLVLLVRGGFVDVSVRVGVGLVLEIRWRVVDWGSWRLLRPNRSRIASPPSVLLHRDQNSTRGTYDNHSATSRCRQWMSVGGRRDDLPGSARARSCTWAPAPTSRTTCLPTGPGLPAAEAITPPADRLVRRCHHRSPRTGNRFPWQGSQP
jgi:hypothetical protein